MTTVQDYCTMWPDRFGSVDWSDCCRAHDIAYATNVVKNVADKALMQCVIETTHWYWLGGLMFLGVSFFGWAFKRKSKGMM